jgi:hypothetical protein
MNDDERLNLKRLIDANECEDNTPKIRELKHSALIYADVLRMQQIKHAKTDVENQCRSKCAFLYKNYTDIFNRVMKDELDLGIMQKMLIILKCIEDGSIDQHEGSAAFGKILKEMYVDSALKTAANLDSDAPQEHVYVEPKAVSWKQYKVGKPTVSPTTPSLS